MRATRPGRGLGWMAGAVGLLVAGRLLRRRAGAALPEPVSWPADALTDAGDPPSAGGALTHEDMAPWEDGGTQETEPQPPPRIRRGPSGREHFWLEP
ncbi:MULTISPECIES: hypothetical protein [unclassified Corallococcus]|uniref:hypothetical protein n=1 Tax=unclassified Corallococcus TaxID=2685029 RepID=UPI001A8EE73A|nr:MULTISPECIES: hypothetical protein [unclassified Corallococcus]MBN9682241.1 hypothetical protein [Corallococcus sp. NCSPR001]WAS86201.1 hypothetical protein O0N60_04325 [Corallococcus sp. NCRR]